MRLPKDMIIHIDTELAGDEVRVIAGPQGELVRCKDCNHRDLFSCPLADNDFQKDEDFCSWGERKGGDSE